MADGVTILPPFDRFAGLRGFSQNLVQGLIQQQRQQQAAQQLQALGLPAGLTSPMAQQAGIQLGLQQQAPFTLGPGQQRFGPGGQPIAQMPAMVKPETVGQIRAQEIRRLQAIPAGQRTLAQNQSLKRLLEGQAAVQVFTGEITKPTITKIEQQVTELQGTLGELQAVEQQFNEDFFTFRGKGKAFFTALAEKAEVPVGKAATDFLKTRAKFFADSKRVFLKFRKFITGVAGGIEEFREIAKATIDPEKDSPTQFSAKLTSMRDNAIRTSNLLLAIRNSGLQPNKTNIKSAISVIPLANIPLEVAPNVNLQTLGAGQPIQSLPNTIEDIDREVRILEEKARR